jgi:hypothetical protein
MRKVTGLRCLYATVAAVALGFSAEYVNAQEEAPLPATPTPPPDVQEREKVAKPPAHPGKSPEVDELLQKIRLTRADIEKRKADKAEKQLPATAEEPPNVKERKKVEKPPAPPGRSPNLDELIEKIKKQPGGAEKLERAKRGGARIPPGGAGGATLESSLERMPGPWVEGPVLAPLSSAKQQTVLRVTKTAAYQTVAGLGSLQVWDNFPWSTFHGATWWGGYYRYASPNDAIVGSYDVRPWLTLSVNLTNPGWYLINVVATRGKASLRKYGTPTGTPPMIPIMTQWDNSATANVYEWYSHVVNLAAGYHYFAWIPDGGVYFWIPEVSVMKL